MDIDSHEPQHPEGPGTSNVLDSVEDAVITTDSAYVITSWNRAATKIYAWTREEAVGAHAGALLGTVWPTPDVREAAMATLDTHGTWRGEVQQKARSGATLHILSAVSALRSPDGVRIGVVAVNRDMTAQRRTEAALAQAEARLTSVQRMEALGELAGGIVHDFNNLLAIISGRAEIALSDLDSHHPARVSVQQIATEVERGAALTRQLLTFARRDSLDVSVLDLSALVRDLIDVARRVIGRENQLEVSLPSGAVSISARPAEVEQAILNLCTNARQALSQPGTIRLRLYVSDAQQAVLEVEDAGVGMSEAVRSQALEAFYTTRPAQQAAGLGLAVVHRVMTRYGGSVELHSEEGVGTRARLLFPLARATEPARPVAPAPDSSRLCVLLAEDQEPVREVLTQLLRSLGHAVIATADGAEAVAVAAQQPFDIFVTDVSMPRLPGPAAAAVLRASRPDLPVVYISGFPREDGSTKGAPWPRGAFRTKPVRRADLQTAIEEAQRAVRSTVGVRTA